MKGHIIRAILYQDMTVKWKGVEEGTSARLNVHQKARQFVEVELGDFLLADGEAILVSFDNTIDGGINHENPEVMSKVDGEENVYRLKIPALVHNTPGEWELQFLVVTGYDVSTGTYEYSYPSDIAKFIEYPSITDDGLVVLTGENLKALYNEILKTRDDFYASGQGRGIYITAVVPPEVTIHGFELSEFVQPPRAIGDLVLDMTGMLWQVREFNEEFAVCDALNISLVGPQGFSPYIGENGNWWIADTDTNIMARGPQGEDGKTPYIGENGNWWIGETDTGIYASGVSNLEDGTGKRSIQTKAEDGEDKEEAFNQTTGRASISIGRYLKNYSTYTGMFGYNHLSEQGGTHNFFGGGSDNKILGSRYSAILGGYSNIIDKGATNGSINGGYNNVLFKNVKNSSITGTSNLVNASSTGQIRVIGASNTVDCDLEYAALFDEEGNYIGGDLVGAGNSSEVWVLGDRNTIKKAQVALVLGKWNTLNASEDSDWITATIVGKLNSITHDNVTALGDGLVSSRRVQTLLGKANDETTTDAKNAALIVGCGYYTYDETTGEFVRYPDNLLVVMNDKRIKCYGKPKEDNDVVRWQELQEVKNDINTFFADADVSQNAVDTLKEVQEYIETDGEAAAEMVASIEETKKTVEALKESVSTQHSQLLTLANNLTYAQGRNDRQDERLTALEESGSGAGEDGVKNGTKLYKHVFELSGDTTCTLYFLSTISAFEDMPTGGDDRETYLRETLWEKRLTGETFNWFSVVDDDLTSYGEVVLCENSTNGLSNPSGGSNAAGRIYIRTYADVKSYDFSSSGVVSYQVIEL